LNLTVGLRTDSQEIGENPPKKKCSREYPSVTEIFLRSHRAVLEVSGVFNTEGEKAVMEWHRLWLTKGGRDVGGDHASERLAYNDAGKKIERLRKGKKQ